MSGRGSGLLPTLTKADGLNGRTYQNDGGDKTKPRLSLLGYARLYPTLIKRDGRTVKGSQPPPVCPGGDPLLWTLAKLLKATDGRLNPTWASWYMGFPREWTKLEPSEMPSSPASRKSSAG